MMCEAYSDCDAGAVQYHSVVEREPILLCMVEVMKRNEPDIPREVEVSAVVVRDHEALPKESEVF